MHHLNHPYTLVVGLKARMKRLLDLYKGLEWGQTLMKLDTLNSWLMEAEIACKERRKSSRRLW